MQQPVLAPVRVPQLQLDWSALPHEQRQAVARHNTQVQNVVQAARLETQAAVLGEEAACDDRARLQQRCAELERELGAARALHLQQAGVPGGQLAQGGGFGGGDVVMQEQDQHERELAEVKAAYEQRLAEVEERLRAEVAGRAHTEHRLEQAGVVMAQAKADVAAAAAAQHQAEQRAQALQTRLNLFNMGVRQMNEALAAAGEQAGVQQGHEGEAAEAAEEEPPEEPAADAQLPEGPAPCAELSAGLTTRLEKEIADLMGVGGPTVTVTSWRGAVHNMISGTKEAISASAGEHNTARFVSARLAAPGVAEADCPVIKAPSMKDGKINPNTTFTISRTVPAAGDSQELKRRLAEAVRFFRPEAMVELMPGAAADSLALHIEFAADPAGPAGANRVHVVQLVAEG